MLSTREELSATNDSVLNEIIHLSFWNYWKGTFVLNPEHCTDKILKV